MVSVETRPAGDGHDVSRRKSAHLEHQQHHRHDSPDTHHPPQHLRYVPALVPALQGAPLDARHVVAAARRPERVVPEPRNAVDEHRVVPDAGHDPATQPRARAPRVGQDPFDELAHRALVPEPAACGERARAHGPRRAQLPEPGRDDGVHDLSGRGGDEDVAGVGRAGEGGATGERVRQVYDPVTMWKTACCFKIGY